MPQKIRIIFVAFLLLVSNLLFAQFKSIKGVVIGSGDVEGIHILNQSSVKYDVTDTDGSFEIFAKLNDTLVVSALKYKTKTVVLNTNNFNKTILQIKLQEKIDELEEVFVGKVLTGSLNSDVGNVEIKKEVNFYDLGIPGYTGKPKTIEERKLFDADHGKMFVYTGIGLAVNVNKLLNKVSGRTKKLKEIVALSENDKCMKRMRDFYSESLFENEKLTSAQQTEYFYFCADDENFSSICKRNDPIEVISFLNKKLSDYNINLQSKED